MPARTVFNIISRSFYSQADEEDITAPPPQIQAAIKNNDIGNLLDLDWDEPAASSPTVAESPRSPTGGSFGGNPLGDLLSLDTAGSNNSPADARAQAPKSNVDDILQLFNAPSTAAPTQKTDLFATNDFFGSSSPAPVNPQQPSHQQQQQQQLSQATKDPFADLL